MAEGEGVVARPIRGGEGYFEALSWREMEFREGQEGFSSATWERGKRFFDPRPEVADYRREVAGYRGEVAGYRGEVADYRGEVADYCGGRGTFWQFALRGWRALHFAFKPKALV